LLALMRARTPTIVVLGLAVAALAAWRAACVLAGPDIDTDAYAHHVIARQILADPTDLSVHWVWLPLFHYAQVPLVALGGTLDHVRWMNVVLAALPPVVLFAYVRRTCRRRPGWTSADATALLAALFAAGCPIAMQMGTTGQPEPLFVLLVLGVAIAFEERRYVAAAAQLGAAVMLRYEAWASLAAVAAIAAFEPAWRRARGLEPEPRAARAWTVVLVPALLILGWAALRRPVDGRWFGFLGDTHAFAAGATGSPGVAARGPIQLVKDALYYPVWVPLRVMGPVVPLVPFGVARTVRQQGARFVLVQVACLGFVSLTWVMRSSLGLDRHFVSVVPLYATFGAQGLAAIADGIARLGRGGRGDRGGSGRVAAIGARALTGALSILAVGGLGVALDRWMDQWKGSIERGFPERAALGAFVHTLPDGAPIFCDDATLELPSRLDRRRFDRHWVDDPRTWALIAEAARAHGSAYVATWSRKIAGHEGAGRVIFRAGERAGEPETGVAVLRVRGGGESEGQAVGEDQAVGDAHAHADADADADQGEGRAAGAAAAAAVR
jgi:hypothetical protein